MKKILSLLLSFCLLLSLIGCAGGMPEESASDNATEPSFTESSDTEPTTPPDSEATVPPTDSSSPTVTEPAVTDPQTTLPPVPEPDVTPPPVTEPEITEPPATRPPATEPEITAPPATRPPVTEPEITTPPATQPSATEPIVTNPPATRPPVTEPVTTQPPATKPSPTQCTHRYILSHTYAANCTTAETKIYTCVRCGNSYQETVGKPLAHSFENATCNKPGVCRNCGTTSDTVLGHKYNTSARCIRCGEAEPGPIDLTVSVRDTRSQPIANVTVSVFLGSGSRPTATAVTGRDGLAHLTVDHLETYQVVLSDLPANVTANSNYTFSSKQANINLPVQPVLDPLDHSLADYQKGSTMADFALTDIDGNLYKLYELLEEKELVILDFWYCACTPCKSEFPYFEEALDRFGNQISLLALNPLDSEDSIIKLRQELGSTFPMLRDTVNLYKGFDVTAYPVTVFIDSDGKVLSIHRGAFSSQEQFLNEIEKYLK